MKVERIATKKRIIRSRGVISSKPVKIATIRVDAYTNHIPGKLRTVKINPARANPPEIIYIIISSIPLVFLI
jgi:hypothetical protein